jgi:pyrimidine-nucleoside phosphorylase
MATASLAPALAPLEVLERSRRGQRVGAPSIEAFLRAWLDGTVSDAQVSAWCMAVCLRGLDAEGTAALTRAMIASGDRLELESLGPVGDKHSTGGVGDATTLVTAPLAASLGVMVAKMSGRGLGHTGGTLDKLEAIPGLTVDLPLERFVRQVRDAGIAVTSASARLVPADRRLYALRDQTATVESPALIAASIMSKKIAGGAKAIALDVKCGSGAFFPDLASAREAAEDMAALGAPWGRSVRYLVTGMDQPLGRYVGNALEVRGAGEVLRGGGPDDLRDLSIRLAGALAEAAGAVPAGEGIARAEAALADGSALAVAERWIEAQGGDPAVWTAPERMGGAPFALEVTLPSHGWVERVDARGIGEAARWLGAGRLHPDQRIDHAVGVELLAKIGARVQAHEPVALVHARDRGLGARGMELVREAYALADHEVETPPLVLAEG